MGPLCKFKPAVLLLCHDLYLHVLLVATPTEVKKTSMPSPVAMGDTDYKGLTFVGKMEISQPSGK